MVHHDASDSQNNDTSSSKSLISALTGLKAFRDTFTGDQVQVPSLKSTQRPRTSIVQFVIVHISRGINSHITQTHIIADSEHFSRADSTHGQLTALFHHTTPISSYNRLTALCCHGRLHFLLALVLISKNQGITISGMVGIKKNMLTRGFDTSECSITTVLPWSNPSLILILFLLTK